MTFHVRAIAGGLSFALASQVGLARADIDSDRAAARAAATEGAKAMDEGRYEQAVDLFTRAEALVHAPPHLLYAARAYVKLGKLVRASETYRKITREVLPAGAPRAFTEAQGAASDELVALEARIPSVKIEVEGEAKDLVIKMDGTEVPKALNGIAHPVDPGDHVFTAAAEGKESDPVSKRIKERSQEIVHLTLRPASHATASSADASSSLPAKDGPSGRSGLRTAAYVAWGAGVVGLAAGTVFLLKNRSSRQDAEALCPNARCPVSQRATVDSLDDDADHAATVSWIGYGVGGAALAAGTVMYVMSTNDKNAAPSSPSSSAFVVRPTVGFLTAGLQGEF
jgi:hypothetical protein